MASDRKKYVVYINKAYETIELSDIEISDAEGEIWEKDYNEAVAS